MKVGSAGVGYTSGAMYKRHRNLNYSSGSQFKRYGEFGLWQPRNRSAMNRAAADGYSTAFAAVGYIAFDATLVQSEGISEIAANKVLARVKQQMIALADSASSLSVANGGNGGTDDTADDTTGNNVNETA